VCTGITVAPVIMHAWDHDVIYVKFDSCVCNLFTDKRAFRVSKRTDRWLLTDVISSALEGEN